MKHCLRTEYVSQSVLKFRMTGTNHETQYKIHIQTFPSITHNVLEILCTILYKKHTFVQLNDIFNFIVISTE